MSFSVTMYLVAKKDSEIDPSELTKRFRDGSYSRTAGEAWNYFLDYRVRDRKFWHAIGYRARRFQITFEEMPANAKRTGKRVRLV